MTQASQPANPFAPIDCLGYVPADSPAASTPAARKSVTVAGSALRSALSQSQPGAWASDHRTETDKFTGWAYVAKHTLGKLAMSATASVYSDRSSRAAAVRKSWRASLGAIWKTVKANESEAQALPESHPLVALLLRANPDESGATFNYERIIQICLTGGCLIWNVPNRAGRTCQRYVIPTAVAQPKAPTRDMPRGGYYINPSSLRQWSQAVYGVPDGYTEMRGFAACIGATIPMEQLQRVGWPHPLWKDDFQSSVSASALWHDTADQTDRSRWSQLRNGPNSSVAVECPADWTPDEAELDRVAKKFNLKYAGVDNHGKAIFVTGGGKIVPLGTTPKDMVYGEAFTQLRDAIMAVDGVSPIAAGIQEGGSYAAFVAALKQTTMLALQPLLDLLAWEDTAQLAPQFGEGLTIEYEAPAIDDPAQIELMLQTDATVGARTLNEHRAIRGLPPVAWGEERAKGGTAMGVPGKPNGMPFDGSVANDGQQQGGSFIGVGRRDYQNSKKARREILADFASGDVTEVVAREELVQLGMPETSAQRLIDAVKGELGGEAEQEPEPEPEPEPAFGGRIGKMLNGNGNGHHNGNGKSAWLERAMKRGGL